jgi:hypothetical protein
MLWRNLWPSYGMGHAHHRCIKRVGVTGWMLVLPRRIELPTSPLPRECSTTELRQHEGLNYNKIGGQSTIFLEFGKGLG